MFESFVKVPKLLCQYSVIKVCFKSNSLYQTESLFYVSSTGILTRGEELTSREQQRFAMHIITLMALSTGMRAGVAGNMREAEFNNSTLKDGKYVISVMQTNPSNDTVFIMTY